MNHLRNFMLDKDSLKLVNDLKLHQNQKEKPQETAEALSEIIGQIHISGVPTQLGSDVISDLEVEMTYDGDHEHDMTLLGRLNTCKLLGGAKYFAAIVMNPVCDILTLESRKQTIVALCGAESINSTVSILDRLHKFEQDVLWMYKRSTSELESLYDMVYFTSIPFRPLNMSSILLTSYNVYRIAVSPVIGCLSPFTMIVMPYVLLKSMGVDVTISYFLKILMYVLFSSNGSSYGYVSVAFTIFMYFQNVLNSIELSRTSYTICAILTSRMNNVMTFLSLGQDLYTSLGIETFGTFVSCDTNFTKVRYKTLRNTFSLIKNFGDQLARFKMFNKETHKALINCIYVMDALCCIQRMTKIPEYSFALFVATTLTVPRLCIEGVFHPCIDNPILNDIALGEANANNIILTSPNGSGKSILIKSILISTVLAQSIIVTCAQCCKLTPFFHISSQINIPDCKGKESLFEAEMHRSKSHLDSISNLRSDQFSFICVDEMFNSTSAIEGVAAAYAVLEQMSKHLNCLNIVSTHYLYLTRLTSEFPGLFENHKMNCLRTKSGIIKYPHKLTKGISSQHIALDLLLQNGFDPFLVSSAKNILNKLTKHKQKQNKKTRELNT